MAWKPLPGTRKLVLPLPRRLLAQVDRLCVDMRLRYRIIVSRADFIRALIDLDETKNTPRVK